MSRKLLASQKVNKTDFIFHKQCEQRKHRHTAAVKRKTCVRYKEVKDTLASHDFSKIKGGFTAYAGNLCINTVNEDN
jgi:hypothetical protein